MTEHDWLTSTDPLAMCDFVRNATTSWKTRWMGWVKARRFKVSDRRWRLLELACCERIATRVRYPQLDALLPFARLHAAGQLTSRDLVGVVEAVTAWITDLHERIPDLSASDYEAARCTATALGRLFAASPPGDGNVLLLASRAVGAVAAVQDPSEGDLGFLGTLRAESEYQVKFVHDVLGNPFRAEFLQPAWRTANDRIVERLAEQIDEEGCYAHLPILADALEDAGCDSSALLTHCRSVRVHVRGCWVVDMLLGRM